MRRVLSVGLWLWLCASSFGAVAEAAGASQWALETFVDLAAADGGVLQVELRRHCCHEIAETTANFCVEFKIPTDDCARLNRFVQESNKTTHCECSDTAIQQAGRQKLSTASVRVVHTDDNRTQWLKLAVHEGDLAVLDDRVDELCERLELDTIVCGNLRNMLRKRSVRDEIQYHKMSLLEHTADARGVERVVVAMEKMMQALLRANEQLRDELAQKAQAYERSVRQAKREHHTLERQVRDLERQLRAHANGTSAGWPRTVSRALAASKVTVRHPLAFTTYPTFAVGSQRIPRVHATNFSYAEYLEFARSSTPVIIEGMMALPGSPGLPRWTLQSLLKVCGDAVVTLKRPVDNTDGERGQATMMWAGIKPVAKVPLQHFLRDLTASGPSMMWPYGYADLYLHDASIRSFCPQLLDNFTFPRYFTNDYLQLLPTSNQASYWPSLFIGGASTASALHADWASTAAWMGLLAGRKHWAIAKPSARAALHELVPTEGAPSQGRFNASLLNGELSASLKPEEVYEDILEAGEVLFIPADCPHQVQNLEQTIAVAANFVDSANVEAFEERIRTARDSTSGDQSRSHARTLRRLEDHAAKRCEADSSSEPIDLSYAQFKALNRLPKQEPQP